MKYCSYNSIWVQAEYFIMECFTVIVRYVILIVHEVNYILVSYFIL